MANILVTGADGFIGSHLCDFLLKKGYAVTAIDNFITGRKENLTEALKNSEFRLVEWDICKPMEESQLPFLKKYGLHGVFHTGLRPAHQESGF